LVQKLGPVIQFSEVRTALNHDGHGGAKKRLLFASVTKLAQCLAIATVNLLAKVPLSLVILSSIWSREVPVVIGSMAPSLHILLVEDFKPFRRFLCSALQEVPGLQIVGEVSDGLEAIHQAERLQPDLILLDIGLPTLDGIEAARRIHRLV
jgi:hypothetical protein